MPTVDATIDDLRRQIDEIDRSLHDLLMRRSDVAAQIGALKNNGGNRQAGGFFRPGREAAVLRRLVQR
ncbi:MAG: chorismate mutase, partial [Dongiaceae bacterium]